MVIKWDETRMLEAWLIMFSILDTISSDPKRGNLIAKPSEKYQVDLDFDYEGLKQSHHFGLKWGGEVTLDENDVDKLKRCSWTAYYYLTEVKTKKQLTGNPFIQMHERLFIKK